MKKSHLVDIIKEVLSEEGSMTGAVGPIATPFAFSKKGAGKNAATKASEKMLGMKTVKRPKRPSNTKMFDYLDEMQTTTPHAFVAETQMENSDAVKHTEKLGYSKVKKSDKKK
tara:strand:+ start:1782 stop:2120 length:339 start_codon:yes stop_codon:yes gene_type:complete